MEVTREDVLRCAMLTDLRLEESEIEPLRIAMEQILRHAASLDALPDAEPLGRALSVPLPRRPDLVGQSLEPDAALGNAPCQGFGHFVVPKVM